MFTLEIAGKPIAVTNADEEQARDLFMSEDFKADLLSLKAEGQPLWDGSSTLTIRAASDDEMDAGEEVLEEEDFELEEGDDTDEDDDDDGIDVVFLVDIDETDGSPTLS